MWSFYSGTTIFNLRTFAFLGFKVIIITFLPDRIHNRYNYHVLNTVIISCSGTQYEMILVFLPNLQKQSTHVYN